MYRIKTDIRQYKCETHEKVEKLIRNWVIRPNDLIYLAESQEWLPVGEHPEFVKLFDILDAQERAEPDTVVTSNPDRKKKPAQELGSADSEEVTHIKERPKPTNDEAEPDESDADVEIAEDESDADLPEIADDAEDDHELDEEEADQADDEEEEGHAEDEAEDEDTNERIDVPDDMRATDIIDEDDVAEHIAREDAEKAAASATVPEAPEGIEPTLPPDEVTMMTERTLDLLIVDDEVSEASDAAETDEPEPEPESESELKAESEGKSDSEVEEEEDAAEDDVDKTLTGPPAADDEEDDAAALEENRDPTADATDRGSLSVSGKRVGRHNLPEEFFATNEISKPVDRDELLLDDLGELSEPESEPEDEEEWEDQDDLRSTAELNPAEIQLAIEGDGQNEDDDFDHYDDDDYDEDEWDEEEEEELGAADVAVLLNRHDDHVENPYAIPLPFEIVPSADDIRIGLKRATRTTAAKDRAFPYPSPKSRHQVWTRTFDLTPKPAEDRTFIIFAGAVGLFVLLVVLLFVLT